MYPRQISFNNFILLSSLLLFSINSGYAIKCYNCVSGENDECYKNPKQEKFEWDCSTPTESNTRALFNQLPRSLESTIMSFMPNNTSKGDSLMNCRTIVQNIADSKIIMRMCLPKVLTCELWEKTNPTTKVESCDECDSDLCNSSNNLTVRFISIIGCLITLWSMRI